MFIEECSFTPIYPLGQNMYCDSVSIDRYLISQNISLRQCSVYCMKIICVGFH